MSTDAAGRIPPALRHFISQYIRSVEQVEILCLLNAHPQRAWTVAEIFRQIQSSEKSVADSLENFRQHELVSVEAAGTYRFAPKTEELGRLASELASAYRDRPVAIVEAIYGKPSEAMQDFADAFKLRKEK